MLRQMTGSLGVGIIGLVGMLFWAVRHPVYAIALGPLAVFAMLNFVIGNRAIFYSAPAVWFGLAFIIITAGRAAYQMVLAQFGKRSTIHTFENLLVTGLMAIFLVAGSYLVSPYKFVPQAAVPPKIISALKSLNNIAPMRMRSWHLGGITDIARYFLTNCLFWPMAAHRLPRPLS